VQRPAPHQAHRGGGGDCAEHQVAGGQAGRGERRSPGPHTQQAEAGEGHQGQEEHPAHRPAEVHVAATQLPLQCGGHALLLRSIEEEAMRRVWRRIFSQLSFPRVSRIFDRQYTCT